MADGCGESNRGATSGRGLARSLLHARVLVVFVVVLGSLVVPSAAGTQTSGASSVVSCSFADSTNGVIVSWLSLPSSADRMVIERSLDGETFEWRGRRDEAEGLFLDSDVADLAPDLDAQSDTDAEDQPDAEPDGELLERAASAMTYRVLAKDGNKTLSTTDCSWGRGNIGRFECSVSIAEDGYLVEWVGGPTGEGLDYIVERDVNDEDVFHWRAREFDRQFVDGGSRALPVYRVTARFDRLPAVSVDCTLDGVLAARAPDASFVCPAPGASFIDTFGADRDGGARRHRGVDMFAPVGTPVLAPESGELVLFWNELGGKSFGLYADSGTFYYGAHLDTFVGEDRRVGAGEMVGTVGNTGNARTTPPHLHFQIHPDGRRTTAANPSAATAVACR